LGRKVVVAQATVEADSVKKSCAAKPDYSIEISASKVELAYGASKKWKGFHRLFDEL
jgi:hypothetical protein